MEMKRVLKVILIRSGILLSLLVVLIMAIKTMMYQEGSSDRQKEEKVLAVLSTTKIEEQEIHLRGIRDGMVYNGLQYSTKLYATPNLITKADIVYLMEPCLAERIIAEGGVSEESILMGYSYIEAPTARYTGIYSGLEWKDVFPVYQDLLPHLARLGVIYTRDSCDGRRQAEALIEMAKMRPNLTVVIQEIDHYGENIETYLLDLFQKVDAVYSVSRDKTIEAHMEAIAAICIKNKIPLIGGGMFGPQKGAVASVDHDPYRIGRKVSDIIRSLEKGQKINTIAIERVTPDLYINLNSAYAIGLEIPADIRKRAKKMYN